MVVLRSAFRPGVALAGALLFAAVWPAEAAILYVASTGSDGNACLRNAPCRTLQRAHDLSAANGEIEVLDSGEYGQQLRIDRSITVSAIGVTASISRVSDGSAIIVDGAGARVVLRGLNLNGNAAASNGIAILTGASVSVEGFTIEDFNANGIRADSFNGEIFIADTVSRDNSGDGLNLTGGALQATVVNSRFENNGGSGVRLEAVVAMITDSIAFGNQASGVAQVNGVSNIVQTIASLNDTGFTIVDGEMTLSRCVARGRFQTGIYAGGGNLHLAHSVVTDNIVGVDLSGGGNVESLGDNTIAGNGLQVTGGSLTPLAPF
jgi:hypothetical protein